ncbi:MAG: alanine racemase, partial [Verrucomicrobiota bacterium]
MREEAKEESGEFWHRLWASVDLDALQHNAKVLQEKAGDKELMAVVKADGYGHGLSQVVKMLWANGVRWFGVAHPTEGLVVLREAPQAKVYTLGPLLSEEWKTAIRAGMILGISTEEELVSLSQLEGIEGTIRVHLVVDTGMGRMGVMEEEWPRLAEVLGQMPGLQCEGVVTHLPSADEDADYTKDQLKRWAAIAAAFPTGERHVGNSAGLLGFDDPSATLVRPGLALYGISPLAELQPLLKPVMSLHARVTLVRRFPKGKGISYGRTFVTPR